MRRPSHLLLSALVLGVGVLLLAFMVLVEGEPGAIPLALVTLGGGWHMWARRRPVAQNREPS
jgi:hypothetical protein